MAGTEDDPPAMAASKIHVDWRRVLLLGLLVLLTIWVFSRFTDLSRLGLTLAEARWTWITVGFAVHLLFFLMNAMLYHYGFGIVGVRAGLADVLPVMFAAYFINVVAPSGGAAGAALFIDDARRRGQSAGRTAIGTVLVLLADLGTLVPFVLYGILFLRGQGKLRIYDTIGAAVYVTFIVLLSGAVAAARWRPSVFRRLLGGVARLVNWAGAKFRRPEVLDARWAARTSSEFREAAAGIARRPGRLALTAGWATAMHIVNLAGLYALFLAFDQPVRLGTLVAGFAMGIVFFVVTIVPSGLAAVEGIMALVFTAMGIPPAQAVAVVLVFRAANFWMPLVIGLALIGRVRAFRRR
jgi:uncharacterized protein (TIRG00374 family)